MKNNGVLITLIIVIGILIASTTIVDKIAGIGTETLSSNGISTIKVQPDEASIIINIETLEDSADVSKQSNQKISSVVMQALNQGYISKVETQSYNIYEDFDYSEEGRKSRGFKTTNLIKITTEDLDSIGKIIDLAVNAGATGITNINFELSKANQEEVKKEALEKAGADARAKAEATASGLGAKIGDIVSISTSDYNYYPYPMLARSGEMDMVVSSEEIAVKIAPQELEVTARVSVVFKVKD
jgi:uncharacterized protein